MTLRDKLEQAWWGVDGGETTHEYDEYLRNGSYRFGCLGDSRHKGVDVRAETGSPIRAWGRGYVRYNSYDAGGYNRFIGLYYPDANMSVDMGHLLNGSVRVGVGEWFEAGQVLALMGTEQDGLGRKGGVEDQHVHFRVGVGDWENRAVSPCNDINPYKLWKALGL